MFKGVQRRLSKSISKAGEILTGVGPTPTKQFKNAIVDGDEEKAIEIYTDPEGDKPLCEDLHPSKPFPTKKAQNNSDTPLHLACKHALLKLIVMLLNRGGDPSALNYHMDTCLHSLLSDSSNPELRATIMEVLLQWEGKIEFGHHEEKVSLNRTNADGETAIHLAAGHGLLACVEKLVALGAIISIVNAGNRTCCELAAENHHLDLALMLELALVFQPIDEELLSLQSFPYDGHRGRLLVQSETMDAARLHAFTHLQIDTVAHALAAAAAAAAAVASGSSSSSSSSSSSASNSNSSSSSGEANGKISAAETHADESKGECGNGSGWAVDKFKARAEALLIAYSWNTSELLTAYQVDASAVLSKARLDPAVMVIMDDETMTAACESSNDEVPPTASNDNDNNKTAASSLEEGSVDTGLPPVPPSIAASSEPQKEDNLLPPPPPPPPGASSVNPEPRTLPEPAPEPLTPPVPPPVPADAPSMSAAKQSEQQQDTSSDSEKVGLQPQAAWEDTTPIAGQEPCMICGEEMLRYVPACHFATAATTSAATTSAAAAVVPVVQEPGRRLLQCNSGHAYCVDCWSSYIKVQVTDAGLGWMPCMGYKCGEILDLCWAPVLLKTPALVDRLLAQRQRSVVDCCAELQPCPVADCGCTLHVPSAAEHKDTEDILACATLCGNGHLFCVQCSQEAHVPCPCEQLPTWNKLVADQIKLTEATMGGKSGGKKKSNGSGGDADGEEGEDGGVDGADLANALWVAANTKRCPRCKTPIEKDEGCNHMSCRKCRKDFCWICMQDWSLHSDSTGGYFQCNRFVASQGEGGGGGAGANAAGEEEDPFMRDMWAEENGNSHAETIRLKEKNRRMARFIHHFTRFQAHEQSMRMEGRMYKQTARRIREGLVASVEGGSLKWLQGVMVPNPMQELVGDAGVHSHTTTTTSGGGGGSGSAGSPTSAQQHTASIHDGTGSSSGGGGAQQNNSNSSHSGNGDASLSPFHTEVPTTAVHSSSMGTSSNPGASSLSPSLAASNHTTSMSGEKAEAPQAGEPVPPPQSSGFAMFAAQFGASLVSTMTAGVGGSVSGEKGSVATGTGINNSERGKGGTPASRYSSKSMNSAEQCLTFLTDGFEELMKSRSMLQWSYPYSYYTFENDDDNDYTGQRSRAPPRRRFGSRLSRMTEDHRTSFELLQGDLESMVETLSDVVARRRLRAGRDQITLAIRAAKSKRIELESVIVSFTIATKQQQQQQEEAAAAMLGTAGSGGGGGGRGSRSAHTTPYSASSRSQQHRQQHSATGSRSAGAGGHLRRARQPWEQQPWERQQQLNRADSDESMDLLTVLSELEDARHANWFAEAMSEMNADRERAANPATAATTTATATAAATPEEMLDTINERTQRLQSLQARMRLIFGGESGGSGSVGGDGVASPPSQSQEEESSSVSIRRMSIAAHNNNNNNSSRSGSGGGGGGGGGTTAVRQARRRSINAATRNAPRSSHLSSSTSNATGTTTATATAGGGVFHSPSQRDNYTIDPSYLVMSDSEDDDDDDDDDFLSTPVRQPRQTSGTFATPPQSRSSNSNDGVHAHVDEDEEAAATRIIREILETGNAEEVNEALQVLREEASEALMLRVQRELGLPELATAAAATADAATAGAVVGSPEGAGSGAGADAGAGGGEGAVDGMDGITATAALLRDVMARGSPEEINQTLETLRREGADGLLMRIDNNSNNDNNNSSSTSTSNNANGRARSSRRGGSLVGGGRGSRNRNRPRNVRGSAVGGGGDGDDGEDDDNDEAAQQQQQQYAIRMERLAARAEEEAQLNRAILMSLQDSQHTGTTNANNEQVDSSITPPMASTTPAAGEEQRGGGQQGGQVDDGIDASTSATLTTAPAAADVEMLQAMGFTQEQSTQALLESRGNVELAANRLLGIDF